ncbi:MAG: hypothetical protein M5R36_00880 [Deltaproteobacteria bacterium]|nr:hypothetical protein [Deltaproteobacteria bacterium]
MTMLFFRTGGGQVGYAAREGDAWTYRVLNGDDERRVNVLFDGFKSKSALGSFELPNALPRDGR